MNPNTYRQVMSRWPTGVSVVTGLASDMSPRGLVIGSFTSVSLEPALVAFFVKQASTSWQDLKAHGRFCVNVLTTEQAACVSRFSKGDVSRRFDGLVLLEPADESAPHPPRIAHCAAWVDADVVKEIELGDHLMVLGRVTNMSAGEPAHSPLVFAQGRLQRPQALTPSLGADHFEHWESTLLALLP